MILQETNRTIVTRIQYKGNDCVYKQFKKIDGKQLTSMVNLMQQHAGFAPCVLGCDYDTNGYYMPFYNTTLLEYVQNNPQQMSECARQLAIGLFSLWQNGYIHRDTHANNIYVSNNAVILGDWEHAKARTLGKPFCLSPDLVGGNGAHAFWDKGGEVDIGNVLGITQEEAITFVKNHIIDLFQWAGGAYWERLSKGQIYGTIRVPGLEIIGRRDPAPRLDMFDIKFAHQTVLDIGCNAGSISFEAHRRGAKNVLGVELWEERVLAANAAAAFAGIDNTVKFRTLNIIENDVLDETYDIVCAFAIDHQIENRSALYKLLCEKARDVVLFETSRQPEEQADVVAELKKAGFYSVKPVGNSVNSDKNKRSRFCYLCL